MIKRKILSLVILFVLWTLLSFYVDQPFLPTPAKVFLLMGQSDILGGLMANLGISLLRVVAALVFAFIPALILGIGSGTNKAMDNLVSPTMYILFPVPKIALLPLVILFFGLGNGSKIFLVALIVFFQFYLNIRDGVMEIDPHFYDSFRSLGGTFTESLGHIIIPAILPRVFSILRLTMGTGIAVLFLSETYASRSGIGWYIMDAWSRLAYGEMYAGILVLGIAGFLLIESVNLAEKLACPY